MKQPGPNGPLETGFTPGAKLPPTLPQKIAVPTYAWIKYFIVAALMILTVGGSAILLGRNKRKAVDWVYINATTGKQNVNLPDGSRLLLRKGSSVAYPSDFGINSRNVRLTGEACFEILYNLSIPFSVNNINGIITEKGTSFIIRSNDSIQQLCVSNGRVRFENNSDDGGMIVLNAGQKAEMVGDKMIRSSSISSNALAWTNERLIFDRTSLQQVALDLNDLYNVKVYIAPEINANRILFTAQFHNQPLASILEEIRRKTGLQVKDEEAGIFISLPVNQAKDNEPVFADEKPPVPETQEMADEKARKKKWWKFWVKK